jgi:hypothetical protein
VEAHGAAANSSGVMISSAKVLALMAGWVMFLPISAHAPRLLGI